VKRLTAELKPTRIPVRADHVDPAELQRAKADLENANQEVERLAKVVTDQESEIGLLTSRNDDFARMSDKHAEEMGALQATLATVDDEATAEKQAIKIQSLEDQVKRLTAELKPTRIPVRADHVDPAELQRAKADLENANQEVKRLENLATDQESEIGLLASRNDDLARTSDKLAEKMDALQATLAVVNDDLKAVQLVRQSLEAENATLLQERERLSSAVTDIDNLRAAARTDAEQIRSLEHQVAIAAASEGEQVDRLAQAALEAQDTVRETESRLAETEARLTRTEESYSNTAELLNDMKTEKQALMQRISELTSERDDASREVSELQEHIQELKLTGTERQGVVMRLRASKSVLEKARDKEAKASRKAETAATELSRELAKAKDEIGRKTKLAEGLGSQVSKLEALLSTSKKKTDIMENDHVSVTLDMVEAKQELDQLRAEVEYFRTKDRDMVPNEKELLKNRLRDMEAQVQMYDESEKAAQESLQEVEQECESVKDQLSTQLAQAKAEVETVKETLAELEEAKALVEQEVAAMKAKVVEAKETHQLASDKWNGEREGLVPRETLAQVTAQLEEVTRSNSNIQSEKKTIAEALEAVEAEAERVSVATRRLFDDLSEVLGHNIDTLEEVAPAFSREHAQLQQAISAQQESDAQLHDFENTAQEKERELNDALGKVTSRLHEIESRTEDLKSELFEKARHLQDVQAEAAGNVEHVAHLTEQLTVLQSDKVEWEAEKARLHQLEVDFRGLETKAQISAEALTQKDSELQEKVTELNNLYQEYAAMKAVSDDHDDGLHRLRSENSELKTKVQELVDARLQIAALEAFQKANEKLNAEKDREIESKTGQLEQVLRDNAAVRVQLNTERTVVQEVRESLSVMERSKMVIEKTLAEAKDATADAQSAHELTTDELDKMTAKYDHMTDIMKEKEAEVDRWKGRSLQAEQELQKVITAKSKLEAHSNLSEQNLDTKNDTIRLLEDEVSSLKDKSHNDDAALEDLRHTNAQLTEKIVVLKTALANTQDAKHTFESKLESVSREIEASAAVLQSVRDLEDELEKARARARGDELTIGNLKKENSELSETVEELGRKLNTNTDDQKLLLAERGQLETQVAQLNSQLSKAICTPRQDTRAIVLKEDVVVESDGSRISLSQGQLLTVTVSDMHDGTTAYTTLVGSRTVTLGSRVVTDASVLLDTLSTDNSRLLAEVDAERSSRSMLEGDCKALKADRDAAVRSNRVLQEQYDGLVQKFLGNELDTNQEVVKELKDQLQVERLAKDSLQELSDGHATDLATLRDAHADLQDRLDALTNLHQESTAAREKAVVRCEELEGQLMAARARGDALAAKSALQDNSAEQVAIARAQAESFHTELKRLRDGLAVLPRAMPDGQAGVQGYAAKANEITGLIRRHEQALDDFEQKMAGLQGRPAMSRTPARPSEAEGVSWYFASEAKALHQILQSAEAKMQSLPQKMPRQPAAGAGPDTLSGADDVVADQQSQRHQMKNLERQLHQAQQAAAGRRVASRATMARLRDLYIKLLRSESKRRALAYQKKYLIMATGHLGETVEESVARLGAKPAGLAPLAKFRAVAMAVVAARRLQGLHQRWEAVKGH